MNKDVEQLKNSSKQDLLTDLPGHYKNTLNGGVKYQNQKSATEGIEDLDQQTFHKVREQDIVDSSEESNFVEDSFGPSDKAAQCIQHLQDEINFLKSEQIILIFYLIFFVLSLYI